MDTKHCLHKSNRGEAWSDGSNSEKDPGVLVDFKLNTSWPCDLVGQVGHLSKKRLNLMSLSDLS